MSRTTTVRPHIRQLPARFDAKLHDQIVRECQAEIRFLKAMQQMRRDLYRASDRMIAEGR